MLNGWGSGYDGYSMSNNARFAYEDGQKPMSKWTKAALLERVNAINPAKTDLLRNVNVETIREHLLEYTAWHHTSSQYNRTDFYGINEEAVENLTAEEVASWERVTKKPTVKDSFRGDINYIEWTGTKKYPKANRRVLTDVNIQEKGSFYIVTDDNGNVLLRKKNGSNGTSVVNYAEQ